MCVCVCVCVMMYRDGGEGRNDSYPEFDGEAQVALQDGTAGLQRSKVNTQCKNRSYSRGREEK